MSNKVRYILCGVLVALAIAAEALFLTGAFDGSQPEYHCVRTPIEHEWECTFQTQAVPAVVYVRPYEDGSAEVLPVDPDGRYQLR